MLRYFPLFIVIALNSEAKPWDAKNDVKKLSPMEFTYEINKLPTKGEIKRAVWGGQYHFPFKDGGTAQITDGGKLTALQKLEKVSPLSEGAHAWEKESNKYFSSYSWGGHCNGLEAAGMQEIEPVKPVRYKGVNFTPKDIKALLIELYQGGMPIVGGRCLAKKNSKQLLTDPDCQDLNPGSFHIALGSKIGLYGEPFAIDARTHGLVFNFTVKSYEAEVKEVDLKEVYWHLGEKERSVYTHNAKAVKFYAVSNRVVTSKDAYQYSYILEVDAAGKIIGGEWSEMSKKDHPDFMWAPHAGYALDNPYIDIMTVIDIASDSY